MDIKDKYLKYKKKYICLKNQIGGDRTVSTSATNIYSKNIIRGVIRHCVPVKEIYCKHVSRALLEPKIYKGVDGHPGQWNPFEYWIKRPTSDGDIPGFFTSVVSFDEEPGIDKYKIYDENRWEYVHMFKITLDNGFLPPGMQFSYIRPNLISMALPNHCERFQLLRIDPSEMEKFQILTQFYEDKQSEQDLNDLMLGKIKTLEIDMDWKLAITMYNFSKCNSVPDIVFNGLPYHNQKWNIKFNNSMDSSSGIIMWHNYIKNTKDKHGKIIQGQIQNFDISVESESIEPVELDEF